VIAPGKEPGEQPDQRPVGEYFRLLGPRGEAERLADHVQGRFRRRCQVSAGVGDAVKFRGRWWVVFGRGVWVWSIQRGGRQYGTSLVM
jgi:hypothetical protein